MGVMATDEPHGSHLPEACAVIVAAGGSRRMGGVDKLLARLAGRPVLAHSVVTFSEHPKVDTVVVVVSEANQVAIEALLEDVAPLARVVLGGARRRDSVRAGLGALPRCEYVLVHDGARPLVTPELIDAALAGAREKDAAICALPVGDTVKQADNYGFSRRTIDREGLWLAQTPQAFRLELLLRAHAANHDDATDDAQLIELLGLPVRIVAGSTRNLKLTTPDDLVLAEALLVSAKTT
jgi:2-C-methyl-D-erythritol 4-phosphate cytidylyltransferase